MDIHLRDAIRWLLNANEPWTRYRALVDLLDYSPHDAEVRAARNDMLNHPQVQKLIASAANWPGYTLTRHNDAKHPLYALSTLADFGLHAADPPIESAIEAVLSRQAP